MASFGFLVLCLYNTFVPVTFPWYLPPTALLGIVTLSSAAGTLCNVLGRRVWELRYLVHLVWLAILGLMVYQFIQTAKQMKVQQLVIEDHHRKQIGLWLRAN